MVPGWPATPASTGCRLHSSKPNGGAGQFSCAGSGLDVRWGHFSPGASVHEPRSAEQSGQYDATPPEDIAVETVKGGRCPGAAGERDRRDADAHGVSIALRRLNDDLQPAARVDPAGN